MIKLKLLVNKILEQRTIPKILYHGTFNQLAISIERDGIVPGGNDIQNFIGIEKGVYLGLTPDYAGSMVEATENENIPEDWFDDIVIITIDTSKLDLTKLDRDPNVAPQEDEYDDSIPADETIYSFIYRDVISKDAIVSIIDYK